MVPVWQMTHLKLPEIPIGKTNDSIVSIPFAIYRKWRYKWTNVSDVTHQHGNINTNTPLPFSRLPVRSLFPKTRLLAIELENKLQTKRTLNIEHSKWCHIQFANNIQTQMILFARRRVAGLFRLSFIIYEAHISLSIQLCIFNNTAYPSEHVLLMCWMHFTTCDDIN